MKIGVLNINSVRNKFHALREVLTKGVLDILALQETKLDDSFPHGSFTVSGYRMYRQDHTERSGGLMIHVRDDIGQRRREDVEVACTEAGRM